MGTSHHRLREGWCGGGLDDAHALKEAELDGGLWLVIRLRRFGLEGAGLTEASRQGQPAPDDT
jgi:hypothetical protein